MIVEIEVIMEEDTEMEHLREFFAPIDNHKLCYSALEGVNRFFEENNWKIYPIGGSMLGAIRYGGLIPWDADVDLFCEPLPSELEDLLIKSVKISNESLIVNRKLWDGRRPGLQIRTKKELRVVIDIFYGIIRDGVIYSLGTKISNFPSSGTQGIDKLQISGTKSWHIFGPSKVYLPNKESCQNYLEWKFGLNWNSEYSVFSQDHSYESKICIKSDNNKDNQIRSWIGEINLEG